MFAILFLTPTWPSPGALVFYGTCLTALGALAGAFFGWLGKRTSSPAELQEWANDTVRLMMDEHRALSGARIAELHQELEVVRDRLGDARRDLLEARCEMTNLKQHNESLLRLQALKGELPFLPDSKLLKGSHDD